MVRHIMPLSSGTQEPAGPSSLSSSDSRSSILRESGVADVGKGPSQPALHPRPCPGCCPPLRLGFLLHPVGCPAVLPGWPL